MGETNYLEHSPNRSVGPLLVENEKTNMIIQSLYCLCVVKCHPVTTKRLNFKALDINLGMVLNCFKIVWEPFKILSQLIPNIQKQFPKAHQLSPNSFKRLPKQKIQTCPKMTKNIPKWCNNRAMRVLWKYLNKSWIIILPIYFYHHVTSLHTHFK